MSAVADMQPAVHFAPRRLGHVNLFVGDLDRSMRFYHDVCGFEEIARERAIGAGFLSNGNTHHDLGLIRTTGGKPLTGRDGQMQVPTGRGERPGLNHLGWELDNERQLVEALERAQAAGVAIHRLADHQISHSVYMFDPDGNLHEFYADAMEDWRAFFHGDLDLITGVWTPGDPPVSPEPKFHPDPEIQQVSDALVHSLRTSHAALLTHDLPRLLAFFTDIAGLQVVRGSASEGVVCLRGSASTQAFDVALLAAREDEEAGLHHFTFELADAAACEAAEGALAGAGIGLETTVDDDAKRSVFVRDPDGLGVEFRFTRNTDSHALAGVEGQQQRFAI